MDQARIDRRQALIFASALGAGHLVPALAQPAMPRRQIPGTSESLPVVGLGSSKVVQEIASGGTEPLAAVLRALVASGGSLVDTWPRDPSNDAAFGTVIDSPEFRDSLFVTTKIDRSGAEAGIEQFHSTLDLYRREQIDLAQIFSLTDVATHWPNLQRFRDEGRARYIGVTVSEARLYDALEAFLAAETPDFVQINFSITERESEDRFLPRLADRGIGIIINRPFMNGSYFRRLENEPLPEWTADFDCTSWAGFSLKYILANQDLTAVLTETSNPEHMRENALAASGPMPDAAVRRRMREFIDALSP
jgi:diketogulonate reductase-like aldo/keto reductase